MDGKEKIRRICDDFRPFVSGIDPNFRGKFDRAPDVFGNEGTPIDALEIIAVVEVGDDRPFSIFWLPYIVIGK